MYALKILSSFYKHYLLSQCKDTTFMYISFNITPTILILSGISLLFSIILILWKYYNLYSLRKSKKESESLSKLNKESNYSESDGVSVIVFSDNNTRDLIQNLPFIIDQDYPLFKIIVVNDGKNEAINDFINRLSLEHKNLRYSYTPDDALNLSRKKLALMIGIKAAKYDIILTTNSNCRPQSNKWISSIARHFQQNTDVVIGHSHISENSDHQKLNLLRSFLTLCNSVKYLVQAICRKPYRGTSDNLAYRKEIFFMNKGFSHSMHLHYGEDDIFVNEIATHNNTKVEITPESTMLTHYENPDRMFETLKLRHLFTERKIHSSAFALDAVKSTISFLNVAIMGSIIIQDYTNLIALAIPIITAIIFSILQIILYRKTAALLSSRKLLFTIPIFALISPIVNLYYRFKSRRHTSYNYTWQPLKK